MGELSVAATAAVKARIELPYLDGLRGLASLYVALYHAYLFTGGTGEHQDLPLVGKLVGFGYLGVPVFIVLSGYLLMLPVVQNRLTFRGGNLRFFRNRARRILPPYYAALVFSLLLILLVPVLQTPSGTQWDSKIPVTPADIVSHAFLAHDFSGEWIGSINGPLWSVAVEWHIYFLMPWLLVPLWRKIGGVVTVALSLAVTLLLAWFDIGSFAHPWFVALFAAGMLAAESSLKGGISFKAIVGSAVILVGGFTLMRIMFSGATLTSFGIEVAAGIGIALILNWAGAATLRSGTPRPLRILESSPVKKLGLFSYSIYLLHSPLLALGNLLTRPLALPVVAQYAVMTLVVLPTTLFVCWLFYLLVERHFLNTRQLHITNAR